jgi:hypothetical protein
VHLGLLVRFVCKKIWCENFTDYLCAPLMNKKLSGSSLGGKMEEFKKDLDR